MEHKAEMAAQAATKENKEKPRPFSSPWLFGSA